MGIVNYRRRNTYLWLFGFICVLYIIKNEMSQPKCTEDHSETSKTDKLAKTFSQPKLISPLHQYPKVDFSQDVQSPQQSSSLGRVGVRIPGTDRWVQFTCETLRMEDTFSLSNCSTDILHPGGLKTLV